MIKSTTQFIKIKFQLKQLLYHVWSLRLLHQLIFWFCSSLHLVLEHWPNNFQAENHVYSKNFDFPKFLPSHFRKLHNFPKNLQHLASACELITSLKHKYPQTPQKRSITSPNFLSNKTSTKISLKKPKFSLPNKQKTAQKRTDSHLTSTKPSDSSTTTNRQQKRTKSNNHKQIIIKNNLIATITNHQTPNETLTTVPPSKTDTRQAKSGKPKGLTFHR